MQENTNRQHSSSKLKGRSAEEYSVNYLLSNGYKILKKNFVFGKGEIDLIAEKDETLVFVEVKWRESMKHEDPVYSLTPNKIKIIKRTAEGYYFINKIEEKECRFDVITIIGDLNKQPLINHIIEAFY